MSCHCLETDQPLSSSEYGGSLTKTKAQYRTGVAQSSVFALEKKRTLENLR